MYDECKFKKTKDREIEYISADGDTRHWLEVTYLLQDKLAEKDKEIERLKTITSYRNDKTRSTIIDGIEFTGEQIIVLNKIGQIRDYCQNQKAIEELEKLKSYIKSEIEDAKVLLDPIEYEDYHEMLGVVRGYKLSLEMVDNRIKELKGE